VVDGSVLRLLRNRCGRFGVDSGYRVDGRNCVHAWRFFCLARKEWAMREKACNDQITFPVFEMRCCFVRGFVGIYAFSS